MGQGEDSGFYPGGGSLEAVGRGGPGPDSCSQSTLLGCGGEDRQDVTCTAAWNPSEQRACPDA